MYFACTDSSHPSQEGDRKSTRLNSSHGSISYAVFCLKKKHSRLDIPGTAVNLVREHKVREQRPHIRLELPGLLVKHHGPAHVRREHDGRQLATQEPDE